MLLEVLKLSIVIWSTGAILGCWLRPPKKTNTFYATVFVVVKLLLTMVAAWAWVWYLGPQ